ncbi:hypothetical protein ACFUEJ_10920 [Gordonia sp. NPDC057258]|uniref:hypothetical protein n=1 Tax=Gordonia sp. NPDC057258 TaxID=3346072 RepID=UPI0036310483
MLELEPSDEPTEADTVGLLRNASGRSLSPWRRTSPGPIAFAAAHTAYNICISYSFAIWVVRGAAAASVIAIAVTHRVRTGQWISMAAPVRAPDPVRT